MDTMLQTLQSIIVKEGGYQKVLKINLSNIKTQFISLKSKQLIEMCPKVYQIDLSNCGLKTLDNLPNLDIDFINLGGNQLNDEQIYKLGMYVNLVQLDLSKNQISKIQTFYSLLNLSKLQQVDLKKNPLCSNINYYQSIFKMCHFVQLKIIDCYSKSGQIISDEQNQDQDLLHQQWMNQQSSQQSIHSQGGLFVDPFDNCLDQQQNDLQLDIEEQDHYSNGSKKIKF